MAGVFFLRSGQGREVVRTGPACSVEVGKVRIDGAANLGAMGNILISHLANSEARQQ